MGEFLPTHPHIDSCNTLKSNVAPAPRGHGHDLRHQHALTGLLMVAKWGSFLPHLRILTLVTHSNHTSHCPQGSWPRSAAPARPHWASIGSKMGEFLPTHPHIDSCNTLKSNVAPAPRGHGHDLRHQHALTGLLLVAKWGSFLPHIRILTLVTHSNQTSHLPPGVTATICGTSTPSLGF